MVRLPPQHWSSTFVSRLRKNCHGSSRGIGRMGRQSCLKHTAEKRHLPAGQYTCTARTRTCGRGRGGGDMVENRILSDLQSIYIYPSIYLSLSVSLCLSIYLSIYIFIYLSIYMFIFSLSLPLLSISSHSS